jgi:hypothetical protein
MTASPPNSAHSDDPHPNPPPVGEGAKKKPPGDLSPRGFALSRQEEDYSPSPMPMSMKPVGHTSEQMWQPTHPW